MVNDELFMELSAYADGELGPERARVLEEKLRADPELRRELNQFQKMDLSTAAIPVPNVDAKLNAMAKSLRPQDSAPAVNEKLNAAARHAPVVSAQRFDAVWKKIAEQTVAPVAADRDAMARSAVADDEFDAAKTAAVPQSAEFEREAKLWRKLDEATAALPVPQMSDLEGREAWHNVVEQTAALSAADRRAIEKIERATAELNVPVPSDEKFAERWSRIAEQLAQTPVAVREELVVSGTPVVSEERWNAMWTRIASRIEKQERQASISTASAAKIPPRTSNLCLPAVGEMSAAEAAPEKKTIQVDFKAPQKRGWGWMAKISVAAVVLLTASLFLPTGPVVPHPPKVPVATVASAAIEIPEALDERYDVQVQYLPGQKEPVVCFFLKDGETKENEDKVKDWKWLPD